VYGTASPSKFTNIVLEPGDEVLIDSPGGGGYGDPRERDPERVARDVKQGFVSVQAARERYGWTG
jgi:N-methylhydantoinase B/oxoprolinase/acetone carboxylase alpha subunit